METGNNTDKIKKQQVIELTSFMMHKHYCENDVNTLVSFIEEPFIWFGAGEYEYDVGGQKVKNIFKQFSGKVPECNISGEEYHVISPENDVYICTGRMWITTAPSTNIYLRVHQRVTMVFRWKNNKFHCHHIHISNPYTEMAEDDVGFPSQMARQTSEYLKEQIAVQRKLIQEQTETLLRLSFEDSLTGLYNRNKFNQIMDEVSNAKSLEGHIGFAYFDLNGLKKVNDLHGHKAGDDLIFRSATHIRKVFDGKAFRIGGDEFVVIDRETDENTFRNSINSICQNMEKDGISISVGITWCSDCYNIMKEFEKADKLMYEEKRKFYNSNGRDRRTR